MGDGDPRGSLKVYSLHIHRRGLGKFPWGHRHCCMAFGRHREVLSTGRDQGLYFWFSQGQRHWGVLAVELLPLLYN